MRAARMHDEPLTPTTPTEGHGAPPTRSFYALTWALYTTQYLGIGFVAVGLVAVFRQQGVDLQTLGALNTVGVAWAFKFLWAPLVDRYGIARLGHYRTWLIACQPTMVILLLLLLRMPPSMETYWSIVSLTAIFVVFSATQDIAADALVVRLVTPEHRGIINGLQIAAGYLGNVIGGGLLVILYDTLGWSVAIATLAAMTASAVVFILTNDQARQAGPTRRTTVKQAFGSLSFLWTQRRVRTWAFLNVPLLSIGVSAVYLLSTPALVDIGWSLTRIGVVSSIVAGVVAIVGSLACGYLVSRFGLQIPLLMGNALTVVSVVMLLPMLGGHRNDALTIVGMSLYMSAYSASSVIIFTVNMDYCRGDSSGSDFTALSSLGMLFSFAAAWPLLTAAKYVGYVSVGLFSIVVLTVGTVLAYRHVRTYHQTHTVGDHQEVSTR